MAEPKEQATRLLAVGEGIVRWSVRESRIGGAPGESYAIRRSMEQVLIDPLPLAPAALERLEAGGRISAIVLTIQSHQRAAWRYAKRFGVPVLAPKGSQGLDGTPDRFYRAGEELPLGLTPIALPGPAFSAHGLLWRSGKGSASVLFCGDLITRTGGRLRLVPDQYMDAPDQARASLRGLLARDIGVLCPGHGAPLLKEVREGLSRLVASQAS